MTDGIKKAGGISFGVSMTTLKLKKDIALARASIGSFVSKTAKSLGKLSGMFGGIGGALTAGSLAYGIKQSIDRIDALNESAKTLGTTTESLSRLGFVASQAESSQESLIRGLGRVSRSTDDAARGVKEMADLYSSLGLNAKELSRLSPDEQFLKIGAAIGGLDNKTAQLVATNRIFGRGVGDLVNVFRLSREELAKLTAEADKFGVTISSESAKKIDEARDAMTKLAAAWGGLKNELTIGAAPGLTTAANTASTGISLFNRISRHMERVNARVNQRSPLHPSFLTPGNRQFMGAGVGLPQFARFQQMQTGIDPQTQALYGAAGDYRRGLGRIGSTYSQIASGLGGGVATAQRRLMMADFMRRANGGGGGGLLQGLLSGLMNSGMGRNAQQIFGGMKNSPVAQFMRMMLGANLKRGKVPIQRKLDQFSAVEAGSVAAHQQRVRGMHQFDRVQLEQRDLLKQIAVNTKISGLQLAPANTSQRA